ncbi:hypothetical protein [uncultured Thomasclavelia sp.]|mgnify:CR=1 FL=1|uniref:hypothetical protein n=1 Tax=uncultured Thomasclavelia sp. TaxID=3025759 RepID=UPI0025E6879B|nr:hypothetical protein [uncultured Thomasclavelia sp.]
MLLEHEKIKKIINEGNELYKQYLSLNTYQFKENSLEYFFIPKNKDILNGDIETVKNYHQYTLTLLQDLIKELDKINDKEGIANRVKERMQRVYDKIATKKIVKPTFSKFDIQKYFNEVTKEIIEAYIDYLDYLQSQIEQKNKTAVNIVEMLNSFLQRINIYSVTCNDGDDWDELKFEPEINVIDNITDDKNKIDTIHKVYRYCYLIDYNSLGNSFVLYPGKTSIWKGR